MAKRYGRNQRRAHRLEIQRLEVDLVNSERRERQARYQAEDAYSRAVSDLAQRGDYVNYTLKRIGDELARAYPEKLREAAEQVMAARRDTPPIRFSASVDWSASVPTTVIRGEIPPLRYNIAVI